MLKSPLGKWSINMHVCMYCLYVCVYVLLVCCTRWFVKLCLWTKPIQMKSTEQYFQVVLHILYQVVLTSKSVDETLVCDHSNES